MWATDRLPLQILLLDEQPRAAAVWGRTRFFFMEAIWCNQRIPSPLSLLRYLQAAAGVTRLRQLPWRLVRIALRQGSTTRRKTN